MSSCRKSQVLAECGEHGRMLAVRSQTLRLPIRGGLPQEPRNHAPHRRPFDVLGKRLTAVAERGGALHAASTIRVPGGVGFRVAQPVLASGAFEEYESA